MRIDVETSDLAATAYVSGVPVQTDVVLVWGDGNTDTIQNESSDPSQSAVGTHTYAAEGRYLVNATCAGDMAYRALNLSLCTPDLAAAMAAGRWVGSSSAPPHDGDRYTLPGG